MQYRQQKLQEFSREDLKKQFEGRYRTRRGLSQSQVKQKEKDRYRQQSNITDLSLNIKNHLDLSLSNRFESKQELSNTLNHINFKHHQKQSCLCNDCSCGRHLCKLAVIKPDMKKQSIYQKMFVQKTPMENIVVKATDTDKLKGNHLDINTVYGKEFRDRLRDAVEKPKPEDTLKFDGPSQELTTYGHCFPGHRGANQYVKLTDKHRRDKFPIIGKSSYAIDFIKRYGNVETSMKIPDQLKTGSSWLGQTTYEKMFKNPNPEDYAQKISKDEKIEKNPSFIHQFETSYKNQFIPKPSPLCPSKIQLELSQRSNYSQSKHLFRENSDYKSMSPDFKAISTSKHFYI